MILPSQLKSQTGNWWSSLLKECIWFPIFMIMFYVTIQIAGAIHSTGISSPNNTASTINSVAEISMDFFRLFIAYAILMGFMILSLKVAKDAGGKGAAGAMVLAGGLTALGAAGASRLIKSPYSATNWVGKNLESYGKNTSRPWMEKTGKFFHLDQAPTFTKFTIPAKKKLGEIKKNLTSTSSIPAPLLWASDKAADAGLGTGFLGKIKKDRDDDAKKKKDAEKEEEEKKKKDKKEKIGKTNKVIENLAKRTENYFNPEDGSIKAGFEEQVKVAVADLKKTLGEFTPNDLKEFELKNFANPLMAQVLGASEANAIEEKLTKEQRDKLRDYIKVTNQKLYADLADGNKRANWGIPKPTKNQETPQAPAAQTQASPVQLTPGAEFEREREERNGDTGGGAGTPTPPSTGGASGGGNRPGPAMADSFARPRTEPRIPNQEAQAQILKDIAELRQAIAAQEFNPVHGEFKDMVRNLINKSPEQFTNILIEKPQIINQMAKGNFSEQDYRAITSRLGPQIIQNLKREFNAANSTLRPYANTPFEKHLQSSYDDTGTLRDFKV